ncbi:MAG: glycoside hydrolase family 43 protein [Bacteroidales bacterium]|nr:glycoside hydrolase family 43 protein [Bacteroidales bacterium]
MKKTLFTTLLLALAFGASAQQRFSYPATPDTAGEHVNAHGGCIFAYNGQWLWYGEARPERGFTSLGVSLYTAPIGTNTESAAQAAPSPASPLALPWTNRGLVLSVVDDTNSPIQRGCIIERPKVLWNASTQLFVMLFHLELKGRGYEAAMTGFATSPNPEGPFTFHHAQRPNAKRWPTDFTEDLIQRAQGLNVNDYPEWWTPSWREAITHGLLLHRDFEQGQMSRDMTVFVDDDGTAWHIYSSEENLTLQAAELTPDYLGYTGRYYRIAPGGQNEAPCIFKREGRYWLICSGCTGWDPNEARMFSATDIRGPWTQHPSPMRGRHAKRTFGAQGTWIWNQSVPASEVPASSDEASSPSATTPTLCFMADVWNPRSLAHSRHLCLPIVFDAEGLPVINGPQ